MAATRRLVASRQPPPRRTALAGRASCARQRPRTHPTRPESGRTWMWRRLVHADTRAQLPIPPGDRQVARDARAPRRSPVSRRYHQRRTDPGRRSRMSRSLPFRTRSRGVRIPRLPEYSPRADSEAVRLHGVVRTDAKMCIRGNARNDSAAATRGDPMSSLFRKPKASTNAEGHAGSSGHARSGEGAAVVTGAATMAPPARCTAAGRTARPRGFGPGLLRADRRCAGYRLSPSGPSSLHPLPIASACASR